MRSENCPANGDTTSLMHEVRRAWLQNDSSALLEILRMLAPLSQYKSRALSRALGVSTRHLQRIFARVVGSAPQSWLNEQRLLAARELLCNGCSVKEVAFTLGFRTISQLSRDFKERFGVAPKAMTETSRQDPPRLRAKRVTEDVRTRTDCACACPAGTSSS
jgi:AraC-like DNA-binding protein